MNNKMFRLLNILLGIIIILPIFVLWSAVQSGFSGYTPTWLAWFDNPIGKAVVSIAPVSLSVFFESLFHLSPLSAYIASYGLLGIFGAFLGAALIFARHKVVFLWLAAMNFFFGIVGSFLGDKAIDVAMLTSNLALLVFVSVLIFLTKRDVNALLE